MLAIAAFERDYQALRAGSGRWSETPEGIAARELADARHRLGAARSTTTTPGTRRRDRRAATDSLPFLTAAVQAAEQRWQEIGQPVADQLHQAIAATRHDIDHLESEELIRRLDGLQIGPQVPEPPFAVEL